MTSPWKPSICNCICIFLDINWTLGLLPPRRHVVWRDSVGVESSGSGHKMRVLGYFSSEVSLACVAGRNCLGARLKFWQRSRVPKKESRDEAVEISRGFPALDSSAVKSYSTILQRLHRQISLDYCTIPPAKQAKVSLVVAPYWWAPERAKQLFMAIIPLCFEFFRCRVDVLQS